MTEAAQIIDPCQQIAADIATAGWSVCPDFLPPERIAALAAELREHQQEGDFRPARIGKGLHMQLRPEIRSDRVLWLDRDAPSVVQRPYFTALESLRQALNLELMLGLFDFEGHMAIYPPGSFYKRHSDQFQGVPLRRITTVLYLNPDWQAADGGQLRIYIPGAAGERSVDVLPVGGTLVTFLTEVFEHEVLPTRRERMSLTGWFKIRGSVVGR